MSRGQDLIRRVNDSIYDALLKLQRKDGEFWCECDDMDRDEDHPGPSGVHRTAEAQRHS
jgi:hypothetical protein